MGGAIVQHLAQDHNVVIIGHEGDFQVALAEPDQVRRTAKAVLGRHGRVDVFVHAAAMVAFGSIEGFDLDTWRQVQAVNVESALLLTQAFIPGMRERRFGRLIFIVSNTFWRPAGGHQVAYVASKGALIGMMRTMALGLGIDGIAAMAVAPGLTRTPATDVVPPQEFADVASHQALARPLTPDDTPPVVTILTRDDAAAASRPTLTVAGSVGR